MKFYWSIIIIVVLITLGITLSSSVFAVEFKFPERLVPNCGPNCTVCDFFKMIQNIIFFMWIAMGSIAVVQIMLGGLLYITSAGGETQIEKAKKTIFYGIVGLVIASTAWLLINLVMQAFNANNKGDWWKINCEKLEFPKPAPTTPTNDNTSDYNTSPPPTEAGDDSDYWGEWNNQKQYASGELSAMLECIRTKKLLPHEAKNITSICEEPGQCETCRNNPSDSGCEHEKNSLHYCKDGSHAVDFDREDLLSKIKSAAYSCGATNAAIHNNNHVHVSIGSCRS